MEEGDEQFKMPLKTWVAIPIKGMKSLDSKIGQEAHDSPDP